MRRARVDTEGTMNTLVRRCREGVLVIAFALLAVIASLSVGVLTAWGWRDFWQGAGPLAWISEFNLVFGTAVGVIVMFAVIFCSGFLLYPAAVVSFAEQRAEGKDEEA